MPGSGPDDAPLLASLSAAGIAAVTVPWDAPFAWEDCAAVVIRSTWDYAQRYEEFLEWLQRLEKLEVPVWNPVRVLRWNSDKRYLAELERKGVAIVPTRWVRPEEAPLLPALMDEAGWDDVVLKPTVGAWGWRTHRVRRADAERAQPLLDQALAAGPAMLQPFIREVATHGELSLVFLGGAFSHAVRKRPGPGEFRVHVEYGGSDEAAEPSADGLASARRAVEAVGEDVLYARVDGVEVDGAFLLMELELIEPELYFRRARIAPRSRSGWRRRRTPAPGRP